MPDLLTFSRNRSTTVDQIDESTLIAYCRLQDTLTDALVRIRVELPDLVITQVQTEVVRTWRLESEDKQDQMQKVIGTRIGPGMRKIFLGLIGDDPDLGQLRFMLEECCHGVILSFTKDTLAQAPDNMEMNADFYREMVKSNIRLYNRCAAFAQGSSIVEGIDPPK